MTLLNQLNSLKSNNHLNLDINFRKHSLQQLQKAITQNENKIFEALYTDLRKNKFESYATEIAFIKNEINIAIKNLNSWSKPKKVSTPLAFMPAKSYIKPTPKGLVLIIAPWNYPFLLALTPLVGAIAAGNSVVLKPSELSLNSSLIIKEIFDNYLDKNCFNVMLGDAQIAIELLAYPFDHIFYTGSSKIGQEVMLAAAKHLSSVTLELGGKSPAIIHESADLFMATKRLMWGKFLNAGQTCVAPDYILLPKNLKTYFIKLCKTHLENMFGLNSQSSQSYGRIINKKHFLRLKNYLSTGFIEHGGRTNEEDLYVEPSILSGIKADSSILHEEIFGPILPIFEYENTNEITEFINKNPYPLALYIFSQNKSFINNIINQNPSGSVCINDCVSQIAIEGLPFGGLRYSGMGNYHGYYSFSAFSHFKSIHQRSNILDNPLKYPPFSANKFKAIRWVL
jgi:aldehyde dehydrogenase (NAD+)